MKDKYITLLIVILFLSFSLNALAASKGKKSADKLSTNVEFNPMTVHGRYQYAAEATAKVENEKVLFDLLGPRKDFKDRLNKQGKQR
ncbi:MAG: hypothetical protein HRT45_13305 [Bdellovibrionales bacterium]|nr:hypothetical protein [Bdellovibrionales bacterium]